MKWNLSTTTNVSGRKTPQYLRGRRERWRERNRNHRRISPLPRGNKYNKHCKTPIRARKNCAKTPTPSPTGPPATRRGSKRERESERERRRREEEE